MVKDFNINATYNGEKHIFQCKPSLFLITAAKHFGLDENTIDLYVIQKDKTKRLISTMDLVDLMRVEIVSKENGTNGNRQRSLRSYFGPEHSVDKKFVENLMSKLKENNTLNGTERKYLLEMIVLNQAENSRASKRKLEDAIGSSSKCKMEHKKVQARPCTSFTFTQTENFSTPDDVETDYISINDRLKRLAGSEQVDKAEAKECMDETYDDRRIFIQVKNPPVISVKEKYPLLFSAEEVKNEIDRIFYTGKCEEFMKKIDKYSKVILNELDENSEIYIKTIKYLERCRTPEDKKYARAVGSILALPTILKEEPTFLKTLDSPSSSNPMYDIYPYIDMPHYQDEVFFDNIIFNVMAENTLLCKARNFKEAIFCLVASFFIFNISYPESCQQTLVMFEKLYLDAHDTTVIDNFTHQMIKLFQIKVSKIP